MPWKTIDFHGIANLDRSLVDHLSHFLDEKQSQIGLAIVDLIQVLEVKQGASLDLPLPTISIRLSESVEVAARRIKEIFVKGEPLLPFDEWKNRVIQRTNTLLWDYVEILESGVTELFQQLRAVPLEQWNGDLFQVVGELKVLFMHHIEDITWAIRRLDDLFWEYRWHSEHHSGIKMLFKKLLFQWTMLIDRSLLVDLDKTRKFLSFHYKNFTTRYREFLKLKMRSEQSMKKFSGYHAFNHLEIEVRERLKQIYQLLKIWNLNLSAKALSKDLLKRSVNNAISLAQAFGVFKDYIRLLERTVYDRSRMYKRLAPDALAGQEAIEFQQDVIESYHAEVHTLWTMISRYREFLLLTDPNPYIRTRWGFSEWTVGPEPEATKKLLDLEYKLERIDQQFGLLEKAVEKGPDHMTRVKDVSEKVYSWLHEMSQPLISKNMMRVNAERVIEVLTELNELGSFEQVAIEFTGDVLSKAMRADWKYHVLFDFVAFEQLYSTHCGIVGEIEDRQHRNRFNKFEELIIKLKAWINTHTVTRHIYEIEQDMNDIKEGLQEFYAYIQRQFSQPNLPREKIQQYVTEASHSLLEYRFLFGKFFHELRETEPEERMIRNRFLFVDQYFESIEAKIQEASNF